MSDNDGEPAEVVDLLQYIKPAVAGIATKQSRGKQIPQAIRQNVEQSVRRLSPASVLGKSLKGDTAMIMDAVYDVHTGKVAFN